LHFWCIAACNFIRKSVAGKVDEWIFADFTRHSRTYLFILSSRMADGIEIPSRIGLNVTISSSLRSRAVHVTLAFINMFTVYTSFLAAPGWFFFYWSRSCRFRIRFYWPYSFAVTLSCSVPIRLACTIIIVVVAGCAYFRPEDIEGWSSYITEINIIVEINKSYLLNFDNSIFVKYIITWLILPD